MCSLKSQAHVFDARPHYPLLVPVKRYWVPEFESTDSDAITLILAHALSFTKEHWEPLLEDLYGQLAITPKNSSPIPKIRDVWAIECPNHGEGAVLNEETLLDGYTPACRCLCRAFANDHTQPNCGNSPSFVGGICKSGAFGFERSRKRYKCRLQVSQPSWGGPLYGGVGSVSSPLILFRGSLLTHFSLPQCSNQDDVPVCLVVNSDPR